MREPVLIPDGQCERMTRNEMNACKYLLSLVSSVGYANDDMGRRMDMIPDGRERMKKAMEDISDILRDILGTVTTRQSQQLLNSAKEMEVRIMPKFSPENVRVVMNKDEFQELIDCARAKCRFCSEDGNSCRKCRLYQILEAQIPLDDYGDGISCPYAFTEWET